MTDHAERLDHLETRAQRTEARVSDLEDEAAGRLNPDPLPLAPEIPLAPRLEPLKWATLDDEAARWADTAVLLGTAAGMGVALFGGYGLDAIHAGGIVALTAAILRR